MNKTKNTINNQNPILIQIRESDGATAESWLSWLEDFEEDMWCGDIEPVHVEHARKVMERVISVYGQGELK